MPIHLPYHGTYLQYGTVTAYNQTTDTAGVNKFILASDGGSRVFSYCRSICAPQPHSSY